MNNIKIGVFGGCFNPPHKMHLNIAKHVLKKGYVDEVVFVPTGDFYEKEDLIDFQDRVNMLELSIDNVTNMSVSKIGGDKKLEFTYQVLDEIARIYGTADVYFICGADNLEDFLNWKNYEYILNKYRILVVKRGDYEISELLDRYDRYRDRILVVEFDSDDISSTKIRRDIKNAKDMLDKRVYDYIIKKKLYEKEE